MGYLGLHITTDETHIVRVCDLSENRREHTLLHELAHVWIAENVDDETRAEFLELRGLTIWHDGKTARQKRGTEHAAEVLAWGVGDHPCWLHPGLNPGDDIDDFAPAFALLVDKLPRCDAEAVKPSVPRRVQKIA